MMKMRPLGRWEGKMKTKKEILKIQVPRREIVSHTMIKNFKVMKTNR